MVMRRTRGGEAKLGGDRHLEGNWGLHFWMPMVDRKQEVEIEKVDLGPRGPRRDMHVGACRGCLKQRCAPAEIGSPNTTTWTYRVMLRELLSK